MPTPPTPPDIADAINGKAKELFDEFEAHCAEVQKMNPTYTDRNIIFFSWSIQKIAGLQSTVLQQAEKIALLEHRMKK